MTRGSKIVHVDEDSDLARLLEEVGTMPLRLVKGGVTYRLTREGNDPWADYDPEAVRAGMRAAAGQFSTEKAEELKAYVYRAREEGTRPANRP
jgi:hypothetical protein